MPAYYDQSISYDAALTYDGILAYDKVDKNIFAARYSDNLLIMTCYDTSGIPVDLTGKTLTGKILEFWDSSKEIPCTISIVDPTIGQYSIEIDDTVAIFRRNQYVYFINIVDGTQVDRVAFGHLVII